MKKTLLLLMCFAGVITAKAQKDPPPPPQPPKIELTKFNPPAKELKDFYNRNPDVSRLFWKSEKYVVVVHKDKTQFVYDMKNQDEKNAFEEKYGKGVMMMPPPPPPPPKPKN